MADSDLRLDALRESLEGGSSDDLRQAAAHLGGAWGAFLGRVTDALEGDDDELRQVVAEAPAADAVRPVLSSLQRGLATQTSGLATQLRALQARFEGSEAQRAELDGGLKSLVALVADDPELTALLAEAAAITAAEGPWSATMALLARLERVVERIGRTGVTADELATVELAVEIAELQQEAEAAEAAITRMNTEVPPLLDRVAALARERQHPIAPLAALHAARSWEATAGPDSADTLERWRIALRAGVAGGQVKTAWVAAKRLQAAALESDDHKQVAVLAHTVADLAESKGAHREAALARLEEAQCLARWPEHHDAAQATLHKGLAQAEADGSAELLLRARLMAGQVRELLGDPNGAARLYERGLRPDAVGDALTPVHGRIALHLGRIRQQLGQSHRAGRSLNLAREIARQAGDAGLLSAATVPLLRWLVAEGQDEKAREVFQQDATALGPSGRAAPLVEAASEALGADVVAAWTR